MAISKKLSDVMQKNGAVITKNPKPAMPATPLKEASPITKEVYPNASETAKVMRAAIRAADAAVTTSQVANGILDQVTNLVKDSANQNQQLINEVTNILTKDQVIKLKVNRSKKDKLITDVDIIRSTP